jgi:1-acyl-sn-glycerol-3-phosphate acyltransferase
MPPGQLTPYEKVLIEINTEDMLISLGLGQIRFGRDLLKNFFRYPALRFARQVLSYDHGVAELGLAGGAESLLKTYIKSLTIHGRDHLPAEGPLLILSNHPGMTDTVALFAALPRPDLRVLAADRPFLRALPATNQYLFYIPEDSDGRMDAVRQTVRHLRAGGAVLTFPGGSIEPDPAVRPGAALALADWSASLGAFVLLAPGLVILPAIVSGVIARQALEHPLTRLRRTPKDRDRLGATIQILAKVFLPKIWPVNVVIDIFPPIQAEDLAALREPEKITAELIRLIRPYYEQIERRN